MNRFTRNVFIFVLAFAATVALGMRDAAAEPGAPTTIVSVLELAVDGLRDRVIFTYSDGYTAWYEQQDVTWEISRVIERLKDLGGYDLMEIQTPCGVGK